MIDRTWRQHFAIGLPALVAGRCQAKTAESSGRLVILLSRYSRLVLLPTGSVATSSLTFMGDSLYDA